LPLRAAGDGVCAVTKPARTKRPVTNMVPARSVALLIALLRFNRNLERDAWCSLGCSPRCVRVNQARKSLRSVRHLAAVESPFAGLTDRVAFGVACPRAEPSPAIVRNSGGDRRGICRLASSLPQ